LNAPNPTTSIIDDEEVRVDQDNELNDKVLNATMWLVSSYEDAAISKEAFDVGIQTIFQVASGFIAPDVRGVVEEAGKVKAIGIDSPVLFYNGKNGSYAMVSWRPGRDFINLITWSGTGGVIPPTIQKKAFGDSENPVAQARIAAIKLVKKLMVTGYEVVK
jgi:hypothetical protein